MTPEIRADLVRTLGGLDRLIDTTCDRALITRQDPYVAVYPDGRPVLADLMVAKANVLCALASAG